ncbi:antitoxin YezG family protein [Priestia megaterium]|uniref:antitoxin YezG family protein n=1 Tax=Priestia megaterium TaxID=1404 RepID=UPI0030C91CD5
MELKLNNIYQKIADSLIEIIPEDWTEIYLYAELGEGSQTSYFFYYPTGNEEPVYSHDIPEIFGVSEQVYEELWSEQLEYFRELANVFKENKQEPWTNLTLYLNNEGNFNVDYGYENILNIDPYEQQVVWEYKHLGIVSEDEYDKKIIEKFFPPNNK